jgi:hypothetical protein
MPTENYRLACELRDRLLAELNENETFKAFQHAQETVNALARAADRQAASNPQQRSGNPTIVRSHRVGSLSSTVLDMAENFLRNRGSRAPSGEIFEYIEANGIEVPGQKPVSVVASYLSNSTRFDNVRGQGYGLPEWSQSETEAPNSETIPFGAPKANGEEPLSP